MATSRFPTNAVDHVGSLKRPPELVQAWRAWEDGKLPFEQLRRVQWVIATGEYDALAPDNRRFDGILSERGIGHHTEIWPGVNGHDWPSWNDAVVRLL